MDEIADELLSATGKYISISTIHQTLINKLEYSLRVCYKSALQRDENHRRLYQESFEVLVKDTQQLVLLRIFTRIEIHCDDEDLGERDVQIE